MTNPTPQPTRRENREITEKHNSYNDYMSIVKIASEHISRAESKVMERCLVEGCRYGIGLPNEKPQDRCIYCGKLRQDYEKDMISSLLNHREKGVDDNRHSKGVKTSIPNFRPTCCFCKGTGIAYKMDKNGITATKISCPRCSVKLNKI